MAARGPSKLGLTPTFCLLIGLLAWRFAVPQAPLWLDLVVLLVIGVLLFGLRGYLQKR